MQRFLLSFAAISGFLSVTFGAFAAHGLKNILTTEALAIFHTGADYQMYHALALLIVSLLVKQNPSSQPLTVSAIAFAVGSLLFCGSLYALALGAPHGLGIITPFGGLGFLIGWLALAVHAYRH